MRSSTNYGLNLVEGSDKVNPLVQDVPNYEKIDTEMKKNKDAGVGTATELKSGTIHAISRANAGNAMFRFTSTSIYETGDSFTVDGEPVTCLMPNGTPLPDKAYVVGSTILCSLVGTLMTVYGVSAGVASDAEKFGGQLPAYYAKASDLNAVQETANNAGVVAENASAGVARIDAHAEYNAGDEIGVAGCLNGYLTTSGSNLVFSVPLTKELSEAVVKATFAGKITVRCNGSYVGGSNGFLVSVVADNPANYCKGIISFTLTLDAPVSALNNHPVAIYASGGCTIVLE